MLTPTLTLDTIMQRLNSVVPILRLPPNFKLSSDFFLPEDQVLIDKYGDAQGNILIGHGRQNVTCLFVSFTDVAKCQQWIKNLLPVPNQPLPVTTACITSAAQQLVDRALFNKNKQDAGLFTSLLLTAAGCTFLQVPAGQMPQEAPNQSLGRTGAFKAGMRAPQTTQLLNDPALTTWDGGWHTAATPTPIHALLLLADSDAKRLATAVAAQKTQLAQQGGTLRVQQDGARLLENGHDIEHFGYADGVSQPIFVKEGSEPHPTRSPLDTKLGPEDLVLVHDALTPGTATKSWGSFLVFRKLDQQVAAFKKAEEVTLVGQLGLTGADKDRAGAMLVGRFEDGTPLPMQSHAGLSPITNNFDYTKDTQGLKCPFHAHVRKMNPRGETGQADEAKHRITRRGVPYGARLPDGAPEDGVSRGLLFMCYQRNIGQQFEFMQQSWSDNANFMFGHGTVGLDPVIGQGARGPLTFPTTWNQPAIKKASFPQFVTLKGGEYFYAPSLTGLARLAGLLVA